MFRVIYCILFFFMATKAAGILKGKHSAPSSSGLQTLANRILESTMVKADEFPSIVALEYKSKSTKQSSGLRCGGSLINSRYVLTAAHCIANKEHVVIKAWLGIMSEKNCLTDTEDVRCINSVRKITVGFRIINELYTRTDKTHDIGLLRLKEEITFSDYVRRICIPAFDFEKQPTFSLQVFATLLFTSDHESAIEDFSLERVCIGGKNINDTCMKNSLGPLMYDFGGVNHDIPWYQHGIVSYDSGCGVVQKPVGYIKISSFDKWINTKFFDQEFRGGAIEICTTPNNVSGTCVPLNRCEEVIKAAYTKNKDKNNFAKASDCYNRYKAPVVCCEYLVNFIASDFITEVIPDQNSCGILKTVPTIGGAEIENVAEFPWLAGIEFSPEHYNINEIRCVGTVIHSQYVLTSDECLFSSRFNPINVWLGHWNSSVHNDCKTVDCRHPVQKIWIESIIRYPFNKIGDKKGAYDIALILLETEINFSDYISPICLPVPNFLPKLEPGTRLTVPRWDKNSTGFVTTSDMILKEDIALVSNGQCNKLLKMNKQPVLRSLNMCAGSEGKLSCDRLMGAPLMRNYEDGPSGRKQWYLEGVVSFVDFECSGKFKGYPGSYTNVTSYLDWIINIISEE